jgi:hypothetical protein
MGSMAAGDLQVELGLAPGLVSVEGEALGLGAVTGAQALLFSRDGVFGVEDPVSAEETEGFHGCGSPMFGGYRFP